MDGITATEQIRELEKTNGKKPVQIYGLSANTLPDDIKKAKAAGMDDYLKKPIKAAELKSFVAGRIKAKLAEDPNFYKAYLPPAADAVDESGAAAVPGFTVDGEAAAVPAAGDAEE